MGLIENLNLGPHLFWFHHEAVTCEQQWEKFHAHRGLEFLYIHQGNGRIVINQKVYDIKPAALFCFQPYQLHRINIYTSPQSPYMRTMFVFDPAVADPYIKLFPSLESFLKHLCKGELLQQMFDMSGNRRLLHLFGDFRRRLETVHEHQYREELNIFIISLLSELRDTIPYVADASASQKKHLRHVERVMDWIEQHYKEEFSLDRLASDLHMSPYHISHLFREEMGCTITDYITARRVQEACLLLSTTSLSIKEIGKKVGWKSDAYFSHIFKKSMGVAPKHYRISAKNVYHRN